MCVRNNGFCFGFVIHTSITWICDVCKKLWILFRFCHTHRDLWCDHLQDNSISCNVVDNSISCPKTIQTAARQHLIWGITDKLLVVAESIAIDGPMEYPRVPATQKECLSTFCRNSILDSAQHAVWTKRISFGLHSSRFPFNSSVKVMWMIHSLQSPECYSPWSVRCLRIQTM